MVFPTNQAPTSVIGKKLVKPLLKSLGLFLRSTALGLPLSLHLLRKLLSGLFCPLRGPAVDCPLGHALTGLVRERTTLLAATAVVGLVTTTGTSLRACMGLALASLVGFDELLTMLRSDYSTMTATRTALRTPSV